MDLRTLQEITPACAGIRGYFSGTLSYEEDHPRVRGDKPSAGKRLRRPGGSPPRARG